MKKRETEQLMKMLNDNEEGHVFTEEEWLVKTVDDILDSYTIDSINIYGIKEVDSLKEDIASLGSEITIDVDNRFTSARTSKIELYSKTDEQYLDFEVANVVSFSYKDSPIEIINDKKETEEVLFNMAEEMIILKTDFVYTSDRGLDAKKILDIYVPYNLVEIIDEEADY